MRIYLHIGLEHVGADRLQKVLDDKREQLRGKGVLFPRAPGGKNHTRLYMAITDPVHIDPLRFNRGFITGDKQQLLRDKLAEDLARDVAQFQPDVMILSASQLSSLHRRSELERLYDLLKPLSTDIRIVAHVDEPACLLARHYATQVMEGRAAPLTRDLELTGSEDWWDACLASTPAIDPQAGIFEETQGAPFWLDYPGLVRHWESVFGAGSVTLRPYDADRFYGADATDELRAMFGIEGNIGKAIPTNPPAQPSAAWLARGRQLNALLLKVLSDRKRLLPRPLWRSFINEIAIEGEPLDPGQLTLISQYFAEANEDLIPDQPALSETLFTPPDDTGTWEECDPGLGYRASQYLLSFMFRIDKATKEEQKAKSADLAQVNGAKPAQSMTDPKKEDPGALSSAALKILPPLAVKNFEMLQTSSFKPHNKLGAVNEEELAAAYTEVPPRQLPEGRSGNVIVGCMKNEAPYIVEWVAYHRAMGVDNFLIYTNDCSDGTSEILDRLQEMGILQHRNNDNWKGNSPQQYALNQALKEPVIKNADWIIHIDVDEFVNVRCGNGTLQDFFDAVPDATNVAMTWRLFGHNGVTRFEDKLVIDQFDTCAPKFCPKPHTVWGFKTMFRNIGAYEKISCHRPNKLDETFKNKVKWVNGSGRDMTREAAENGWRSSKKSIGYDLLQLNHYALRSAESFLIKRQRGRALHVDRSIGLNYWIRMDWSDFKDITIKRNVPRLQAEYDRLMADDTLRGWHEKGLDWHRAKAEELHGMDEFEDLYQQALKIKLNETERVAYALALDMES
ncbi:MAG: glycosyltransferase family 2 protein [Rhodobacteraceae bacterium]|nr:glycosyltransferase family 2 protein [Paracoccaceae bacterium]